MKYKLTFVKISNEHAFAGVGFAGNIFIVLNSLMYVSYDDDLYVDMETNECCCSDSQVSEKTKNCWEYYFDQTSNQPVEKEFNSLLNAKIHYEDRSFFLYPENFIELKNKFWKNFKLKESIKKEIESFYETNISGKTTLGVQVRLTDMKHYHGVSSIDSYVNKINEILSLNPNIEQIFLSTDDSEVIDILKNKVNKKIIYYEDMFRATKNDPHLHPYDRFNNDRYLHKYLIGVECCKEIFTLAKFDFLLKADVSSISIVSIILSENIQKVFKL